MHNNIYEVKNKCCGCHNCETICPKDAIEFVTSDEGFDYPNVNSNCVDCGMCQKVCPIISVPQRRISEKAFSAFVNDREMLRKSSSGGIFGAIAKSVLNKGGIVCGCAEDEVGNPKHILIEDANELERLQGSKYAESDMTNIVSEIKKIIQNERLVLFSGTPCQVAAIRNLIGNQKKLWTVDIICHGVPSRLIYQAYLQWYEEKNGGKLQSFVFRSKKKHDWSLTYRAEIRKGIKIKAIERMASLTPYYYHFLRGYDYRESCYQCNYACPERVGDITLGDFWGVENIDWKLYNYDGVSAVLINSDTGELIWQEIKSDVQAEEIPAEIVRGYNGQLNYPSRRPKERDEIYSILREQGYEEIYKKYRNRKVELIDSIKDRIPNRVRIRIKKRMKELKRR